MTPSSTFATKTNPFTGQDLMKFVPVPNVPSKRKGMTAHDDKFEKLLDFEQALSMPESEFQAVRKALQRFMDNRGLRQQVTIRQHKDYRTKTYTLWLANEPPRVVIPRSKQ